MLTAVGAEPKFFDSVAFRQTESLFDRRRQFLVRDERGAENSRLAVGNFNSSSRIKVERLAVRVRFRKAVPSILMIVGGSAFGV